MKSYDEIIGFDYTDENDWKEWIREKFVPLNNQLSFILKLREHLENILKTNLKEAFGQESIKEILLGGITKDGEYTQNSLAKLYKDALGISINPKEWVAYCRAGLNPVENGIECKFEDTPFLAFVTEIKELVKEVLSKIEIEPQDVEDKEIKEIVDSPEKILEIIREIYKSIVSISANHDYHMFFILNTRCVPRFFIEKAYPKLKENFEKVAKILEIEEVFIPNIDDEGIEKGCTLIGHKEGGIADLLFDVQHTLWNYFNFSKDHFWDGKKWINLKGIKEIFSLILTPTDLKEEFEEMVSKFLPHNTDISKNIILISFNRFDCKSCIKEFEQQDRRYGYWYDRKVHNILFKIKNSLIEKVEHGLSYKRSWSGSKGYTSRIHDEYLPVADLLSNLSPFLFLGFVFLKIKEKDILLALLDD